MHLRGKLPRHEIDRNKSVMRRMSYGTNDRHDGTSPLWIWVLGIELDVFIIGVNLTREIQNVFLEASTRFRKHGMRCCLLDV